MVKIYRIIRIKLNQLV